jgi:dephospho-CoA kinase
MKRMLIIGLTGGIGMGKSTAAHILRDFGLPIYHADKAVHRLLRKKGAAVKEVAQLFPAALKKGAIDRVLLGHMVFNRPHKLKQLERTLHPHVREAEKDFLRVAAKKKAPVAILEIPLLFETKGERRCDFTICVTAPKKVQKARVMQRRGMTITKFKAILKRQMSDAEKKRRADYVVHTGGSYARTKAQLRRILRKINIL